MSATLTLLLVLILGGIELVWLCILTAAWVAMRHRHDRLSRRVTALSGAVQKAQRVRHPRTGPGTTGSMPAPTPGPVIGKPPPLLPWDRSPVTPPPPAPELPPADPTPPTAVLPPLPYGRHARRPN